MRTRIGVAIVTIVLLMAFDVPHLEAQIPVPVKYARDWNMVGGPPGTDLSGAQAVDTYSGGGHTRTSSAHTALCQGYWAYFSAPTRVWLAGTPVGSVQTCSLQAGWNMVGNPFADNAMPNVAGYYWNPAAGRYDLTDGILAGKAVWIYSPGPSSITLRSSSWLPDRIAPPPAPLTPHVGDTFMLVLAKYMISNVPASARYTVRFDPKYVQLESKATTTSLVWRFRALAPPGTDIIVEPACRQATLPCTTGGAGHIGVTILP